MDDCQGWRLLAINDGGDAAASANGNLTGSRCAYTSNEQMGMQDLIFLADNDPQTSSQHCLVLECAGYRVKHCPLDALSNAINGTQQGIVVLNLGSNVNAGLVAQQQLLAKGLLWLVIFIADCDRIPVAVKAMKAGAIDFHETSDTPEELLQSVQEAMLHLDIRKNHLLYRATIEQRCASLTRREKEIMQYVTNGVTNQDTAQQLGLSMRTIEVHRSRVMKKMGATCLAELTRMTDLCSLFDVDN
jgi:FixJ family two-component response regulator